MSRAKSVTAPRKKTAKPRIAKTFDTKYMGEEPEWVNAENWTDEEIQREKRHAYNWYNYFYKASDLKKNLYAWMKEAGYSAADIKSARAYPDAMLSGAVVANATMLLRGMPNTESGWLRDKVAGMIDYGKNIVSKKKKEEKKASNVYKPSIQERMAEQLSDIIAEMDEWEDTIMANPKASTPKVFEWMKQKNVAQSHINKIIAYYEPKKAEIEELTGKASEIDPDLKEGYAHLSKTDIKRILEFYNNLLDDMNSYMNLKKVSRKTRSKKAPTKGKQVAKLKYKAEDKDLKLVSIRPEDIIGAETLWLYNTKLRKLYKVVADPNMKQLAVKGTTIIGYDEANSVGKNIRKPEEKLKEFNKAGKVALRKFLDEIKAVEVKFPGRTNEHTILLKTY